MKRRRLSVLVLCLAICGSAAARTWNGSQNGNWSAAANWSPAGTPVAGEALIFPAGASNQTMTNDLPADFSVGDLSLQDSYVLGGNALTVLGNVKALGNQQINLPIKLGADSHFNVNDPASLNGAVDVNGHTLSIDAFNMHMNGPLNGSGSIVVANGGSVTITGSGNFNGNLEGFALLLGASLPNMTFSKLGANKVVLTGYGTLGVVAIPAASPGSDASILRPGLDCCGNVLGGGVLHTKLLTLGGTYMNDLFPAAQSDSMQVTGSVTLGGTLEVSFPSGAPAPGQSFTIIDNDGTDAVNGTFAGLPERAMFTAGGSLMRISYRGGDGNDVVLTVVGDTSAVLTQTTNATKPGEPFTLTDTVSSALGTPTGSVQFAADGIVLGAAPLVNGVASLTTALANAGGHDLHASFLGTGAFADNVSNSIAHTVTRGQSRTEIFSDSANTSYGQVVHFTIAVAAQAPASGQPAGTVTVFADGVPLGTAPVFGATAKFETAVLHAGLKSITATYNGDTNFDGSTAAAIQQNIVKARTVVDPSLRARIFLGEPPVITVFVNVTPNSTLTVSGTVKISEAGVDLGTQTLTGGTTAFALSPLAVGDHTLVVTYEGDTDFEASTATVIETVVAPAVTAHEVRVVEGNKGVTTFALVLSLSAPVSQTVRVSFSTIDGSAIEGQDYEKASGIVEFAPGEVTRVIELHIFGDTFPEGDETFSVRLSDPLNATIDTQSVTVVIANDDQVPPRHRPSRP